MHRLPTGHTAAHVRVEDKASEIDAVAGLLAGIDIAGCVTGTLRPRGPGTPQPRRDLH
ncbi:hypothetical protein [Streptomonospora arabica]|uniref:Uncharacterized protein n=1 Tax=Streptomonospora arabica TaxID=412417 RepID=A0ABV9SP99_9ACTN